MNLKGIPVVSVGAGSQPVDEDGQTLSYIDMPKDMWKYEPPAIPSPDEVSDLAAARQAMEWLRGALAGVATTTEPLLANLTQLDAANRDLVNQVLGEGEVSVTYNGVVRARTQESVLAGVWRTLYLNQQDQVSFDLLEVADIAHLVRMPDGRQRQIDTRAEGAPAEVMNALPILAELASRCEVFEQNGTSHTINLTLLPLSEADVVFLDERLGRGPVEILSRAYGKCQVISTQVANVWWIRYFNSMSTLILNTLEVTDVPLVACAAAEDLRDSAERLNEILQPYWEDSY